MRAAVFWIMVLALRRDRGVLVMSFVLPPAIFLIFAAVFAGATDGDIRIKVAVADEVRSAHSRLLTRAIAGSPRLTLVGNIAAAGGDVRRAVTRGEADAGLVIARGGVPIDRLAKAGPRPLLVIRDPSRAVAAQVLMAEVRRLYYTAARAAALRNLIDFVAENLTPLTDEQRTRIDRVLKVLTENPPPAAAVPVFERLYRQEQVAAAINDPIAYYAGAVAVLFLLFSAVQVGASLLEERETGILERIVSGPGGIGVLVDGKLAFMVALGVLQVVLIFGIAWAVHGVSLAGHVLPWALITVLAAWAAAGLALLLAAACGSRRQMLTAGNFVVLVLSAIGGSMVPRYVMPDWLQDLGWLTPNTWALEAYDSVLRRGGTAADIWPSLAVLFAAGLIGWAGARLLARRFEHL